jgi:hypothetical protein
MNVQQGTVRLWGDHASTSPDQPSAETAGWATTRRGAASLVPELPLKGGELVSAASR